MRFGGGIQENFGGKISRSHQQHLYLHARFGGRTAPGKRPRAARVRHEPGHAAEELMGLLGLFGGRHQAHDFHGFEAPANFAGYGHLLGL